MLNKELRILKCALVLLLPALLATETTLCAGMPSPLPSQWTAGSGFDGAHTDDSAVALRVQAISFFLAVFLVSGWLVRAMWNFVRRDFPSLPSLNFGRALGLVGLWGLSFVIVLTMISGARELMTPGAWRKQGWTYRLDDAASTADASQRAIRQRRLEELRTSLWQYAATHDGRLPGTDDPAIEPGLWEVPGWPGLKYLSVPDRRADTAGQLYVFEPEIDSDERLVLLSNGLIGSMSSSGIKLSVEEARSQQAVAEELQSGSAAMQSSDTINQPVNEVASEGAGL